jgi:hypothetical protein
MVTGHSVGLRVTEHPKEFSLNHGAALWRCAIDVI